MSAKSYQVQFVHAEVDHTLVDVRLPWEYAQSHLAGAVNIPLQELPVRLGEIPKTRPVVLYCRSGNRSGQAAQFLQGLSYSSVLNAGGLADLAALGLPTET